MANSAQCERIYACFTAAELAAAQYPATEAACVTQLNTASGCDAETEANACTAVGGNAVYHGDKVPGCISQINGLTCAQVRDPNFNLDVAAPICGEVCATPS